MTTLRTLLAVSCATALSGAALAETPAACPLTYEAFEYSVPHTDMEACPRAMAREGVYCRLVVNAEIATVYAFSEADDCIAETRAFEGDSFEVSFK